MYISLKTLNAGGYYFIELKDICWKQVRGKQTWTFTTKAHGVPVICGHLECPRKGHSDKAKTGTDYNTLVFGYLYQCSLEVAS